jgi:hypothetical protein
MKGRCFVEKRISVGDLVRCGGYWTVAELSGDRVLVSCEWIHFSASRLVWWPDKECWVRREDLGAMVAEHAAEEQLIALCRAALEVVS